MPRACLHRTPRSHRRPRTSAPVVAALAVALVLMLTAAALLLAVAAPARAAADDAADTPPLPLVLPSMEDFSGMSWVGGFAQLVTKMQREYAFGDWKRIDWSALYSEYAPQVARAQARHDELAYYLTLRRFMLRMRDGHVKMETWSPDADALLARAYTRLADGGFGLVPARLADGHVVAAWVQPGGPAARAGVKVGARLLRWRGRPVDVAVRHVDTALSYSYPTSARLDRERLRFLVRARVGAHRTVVFRDRGATAARTARLTAVDDDLLTLTKTDERSTLVLDGWPERMVTSEVLPGDIGYVKVRIELDLPADQPGDHTPTLQEFRDAIHQFIQAGVRGVVVDLRRNSGGSDQMAAAMLGSFSTEPSFYEYLDWYNTVTGRWEIWDVDPETLAPIAPGVGAWIEPALEQYTGPVAALVDNGCVSSGEGLAMGLRRLPNAKTVGFCGTNGSFGVTGDGALLPGLISIKWPFARSLDEHKVVQDDAREGRGGVLPEVRVPATVRNISRQYAGSDVVLEYGLRALEQMAQ